MSLPIRIGVIFSRRSLTRATTPALTSQHTLSTATRVKSAPEKEKKDVVGVKELVGNLAETHALTLAESRRIIDTLCDSISDALSDQKSVTIPKFGTFSTYTAKARTGRNPTTGEPIQVPAKERIKFKAFSALKKIVEDKKQ